MIMRFILSGHHPVLCCLFPYTTLLKRIHGGAMFVGEGAGLPALEERSSSQIAEKRHIARVAAARIRDGDAILLDGGTTTLGVAKLLVGRSLQIVTNRLPIAHRFS